ncbi:MAG: DUF58 domain-containing protein [Phycisphaerales bacterium]|nr:DUF58 domain-containing protein [Phycisphaerales bacterium]
MNLGQAALRSALDGLDVRARRIIDGIRSGAHPSNRAGAAVEFDRHRAYQPGDDLRHLDWRVFARSDRLVLKRARMETALDVMFMMDGSGSMQFESGGVWGSKQELASAVAEALAWLAADSGDRVAACPCHVSAPQPTAMSGGVDGLSNVVHMLSRTPANGLKMDLDASAQVVVRCMRHPGLVLICSDLLDPNIAFRRALGRLRHAGHDVLVLQILDQSERLFDVPEQVLLQDLEGGGSHRVTAAHIRDDYLRVLQAHQDEILSVCRGLHVDHVLLDPHESPIPALRELLQRRSGGTGMTSLSG